MDITAHKATIVAICCIIAPFIYMWIIFDVIPSYKKWFKEDHNDNNPTKNAGCQNCAWYLEKDVGKLKLSKVSSRFIMMPGWEDDDPRLFNHCIGYYDEYYDMMTGEITHSTTSCYMYNNNGHCSKFLHKDDLIAIDEINNTMRVLTSYDRFYAKVYWTLRKLQEMV